MAKRTRIPGTRWIVSVCLVGLVGSSMPQAPAAAAGATCFGEPATMIVEGKSRTVRATPGDDVIVVRGPHMKVYGRGGNDFICSANGGDLLYGGSGSDKLRPGLWIRNDDDFRDGSAYGGRGHDLLTNETYSYLRGGPGNDRLIGRTELTGGRGDDVLIGIGPAEGQADLTTTFSGGPGNDVLRGKGSKEDTATFEKARSGVVVDLREGTAAGSGTDVLIGIENVIGSNFDDVIAGDDLQHPGHPDDLGRSNEIRGGRGEDLLFGRGGEDVISGDEGTDSVLGGRGDDFLEGGGSSPTREPNANGPDLVVGGAGEDFISSGGEEEALIRAGPGDDRVYGSYRKDRIYAGPGDDRVDALWGSDLIEGGSGDDYLSGFEDSRLYSIPNDLLSSDQIVGGDGTDRCMAGEKYERCEWFD